MAPPLLRQLPDPPAGRTGWPWTEETDPALYDRSLHWPRLSIVTPSYQQGHFLEETLRSVLLQNYPNLEYLVIDGGSRDGTGRVLERYSPWLSHQVSERDDGQSHALNKGFDRASGELLGWINSDDLYLPGAFRKVALAAGSRRRADGFFGDYLWEHENRPGERQRQHLHPVFRFQVQVGYALPSHATFWRRPAHQRLNESLQFTLDAELFKRMAARGVRFHHLPEALSVVRFHSQAKTARLQHIGQAETEAWKAGTPALNKVLWWANLLLIKIQRRL